MNQELKSLLLNLFAGEEHLFGSVDKCTVDRADIEALRAWYRRELQEVKSVEDVIKAALDELDKGAA